MKRYVNITKIILKVNRKANKYHPTYGRTSYASVWIWSRQQLAKAPRIAGSTSVEVHSTIVNYWLCVVTDDINNHVSLRWIRWRALIFQTNLIWFSENDFREEYKYRALRRASTRRELQLAEGIPEIGLELVIWPKSITCRSPTFCFTSGCTD